MHQTTPNSSFAGERAAVAARAADALARADLAALPALVGFDGFVDSIIDVVAQRHAPGPAGYRRIGAIPEYAARCAAAAGKSTNVEIVVKEERFGGNGPLMAGALAQLGLPITFVGCVAQDGAPAAIHPAFAPFAARCDAAGGRVIPVAPPACTHALEFDDGKLMMNDPRHVQAIDWPALKAALGLDRLRALFAGAPLAAIVNWTNMPSVTGIIDALIADIFSAPSPAAPRPRIFIDLSDPARRTDADLAEMLSALARLSAHAPVTLGLNLAEAEQVDRVSAARAFPAAARTGEDLLRAAIALRARLDLDAVVIHPRDGAAAADRAGRSAWFAGPLCAKPRLSTGAGDHFNAGFALAQMLALPLDEACALGCALSGAYVRDAHSPSRERLIAFLRELPDPESC